METSPRCSTTFSLLLCCLVCWLLLVCPIQSQEVEDESEFSYDEHSQTGPANWGAIRPEWSTCNTGNMQSPIDLVNERVEIVSNLGNLQRDYESSNATLINRGHDMMLEWANGAGDIRINGTSYTLRQLHWHLPSEHSINGRRFDMELHLVHETEDGKIAVTGIMYKTGRPDSFLSMLENNLEALTGKGDMEIGVGNIDPKQIKIGSRKYYRYIGSLTVPPCTENVVWTIVKKVRTVSTYQQKLIRRAVHEDFDNARPSQQLNSRIVRMYRPEINRDP